GAPANRGSRWFRSRQSSLRDPVDESFSCSLLLEQRITGRRGAFSPRIAIFCSDFAADRSSLRNNCTAKRNRRGSAARGDRYVVRRELRDWALSHGTDQRAPLGRACATIDKQIEQRLENTGCQ